MIRSAHSSATEPSAAGRGLGIADEPCAASSRDLDLLPAFALAWLVSALRVAGALYGHKPFGVEATLALVALFVIPVVSRPRRVD